MPQINLLKQKPSGNGVSLASLAVKILAILLLALLGYYAWLYYSIGKASAQAAEAQQQIQAAQNSSVANSEDRDQLLSRQQQLAALQGLIGQHVYWSYILPELARVTLNTATYSSIKITPDGHINLTVNVPEIADLDLFLQVFNLPQFNANFSNVRVVDYHNVQSGATTSVQFDVEMDYNQALLQYKPSTDAGPTGANQ